MDQYPDEEEEFELRYQEELLMLDDLPPDGGGESKNKYPKKVQFKYFITSLQRFLYLRTLLSTKMTLLMPLIQSKLWIHHIFHKSPTLELLLV